MFEDRTAESDADFPSSWKQELSVAEQEIQTDECKVQDQESQSTEFASIEVQTITVEETASPDTLDMDALAEFVNKAALLIEEELDLIATSRAFDTIMSYGDEDEEENDVTLVNTIEVVDGLSISDIDWNNTGGNLVVGLSGGEHVEWCTHLPDLNIYRVDRSGTIVGGKPQQRFNLPSCISQVAAHPSDPQLLAAGTVTGEILLFKMDRGENELSIGQVESHAPVVSLLWMSRVNLLACHSNGILRLWILDTKKYTLSLTKTFKVSSKHMPKQFKSLRSGEVGVRHASFSQDEPDRAIIGTESGAVVLADIESELILTDGGDEELYDPVALVYPLHTAPINCIAVSPIDGSIFATTAQDGILNIISMVQPTMPVISYQMDTPPNYCDWSSIKPGVIGVASTGAVYIFDVLQNKSAAIHKLSAGDKFGRIYVWRLPPILSTSNIHENAQFQSMVFNVE
ncbi:WD repeat-containing protein 34 isoform X2 [Eurytemora carolleeae]|uniref:WD repeat-containing protein 34 isoform X2 n=1 Tax=Eurytemora carolleeae TaxID=1294199 RepID=UPI000C773F17|nr:WD repeat-containing protein 34 isoform X2 [Eurytemora carolleeae]|eukprot:XP_023341532.1 WD repeat-containing protein 34-like isoform X2 [Eurytemora affinis]